MAFHLAKCAHLQKGNYALVQPCAMTETSAPINIWCASLTKTKGNHEQKLKALHTDLQFSTQHMGTILCLQKKLEIEKNVIRSKE